MRSLNALSIGEAGKKGSDLSHGWAVCTWNFEAILIVPRSRRCASIPSCTGMRFVERAAGWVIAGSPQLVGGRASMSFTPAWERVTMGIADRINTGMLRRYWHVQFEAKQTATEVISNPPRRASTRGIGPMSLPPAKTLAIVGLAVESKRAKSDRPAYKQRRGAKAWKCTSRRHARFKTAASPGTSPRPGGVA